MKVPLKNRFWTKVKKTNRCWEWVAGHRKGYGAIAITPSFNAPAHRIAWELTHGKIQNGLLVLHHCDNKTCVRPSHLFLGTVADNKQDEIAKGRYIHGEQQWFSKLTDKKVLAMRSMKRNRYTLRQIANRFHVGKSTVFHVLHRESWKHLP